MTDTHATPLRQSPLVELGLPADGLGDPARLRLAERGDRIHLNLRGDASDGAFVAAVEAVTGLRPPPANRAVDNDRGVLLWLGPDEFLWHGEAREPATAASLVAALETALSGRHAGVVDLSGGQTVLVLEGPAARDLLAKGCPLDLHPRHFGPGQCAQTLLERVPVCIRQSDAGPAYELVVRRSFADYLARWLLDAGGEFGLAGAAG